MAAENNMNRKRDHSEVVEDSQTTMDLKRQRNRLNRLAGYDVAAQMMRDKLHLFTTRMIKLVPYFTDTLYLCKVNAVHECGIMDYDLPALSYDLSAYAKFNPCTVDVNKGLLHLFSSAKRSLPNFDPLLIHMCRVGSLKLDVYYQRAHMTGETCHMLNVISSEHFRAYTIERYEGRDTQPSIHQLSVIAYRLRHLSVTYGYSDMPIATAGLIWVILGCGGNLFYAIMTDSFMQYALIEMLVIMDAVGHYIVPNAALFIRKKMAFCFTQFFAAAKWLLYNDDDSSYDVPGPVLCRIRQVQRILKSENHFTLEGVISNYLGPVVTSFANELSANLAVHDATVMRLLPPLDCSLVD